MDKFLIILQITFSILLVVLIMIQPKGNKSFTRRGLDKLIYKITYVVATLFIAVSLLMLII